ncbi:hypothetical protein PUN28_020579 [Cardiocondyla obscurior]|uniref:Uncharacterized protein n=1 Tax=Cardiocondyla obscurior TaxID=286306 RepID=A0AAW2E4P0_9HYME
MVRLVFRPYTQFRRSICTSESLRTSIRVSPDFRARTGDGARSVSLRVPWRALATASTHSRVCELRPDTLRFFSTFPHGTCSLSVSWSYLALDGVYHPLRAALSSNPTLRRDPPETRTGRYGPGTLCG